MDELSHRNTETVKQVLQDIDKQIREQQIRIDKLQTTVTMLTQKITTLETNIMLMRANSFGTGPTVK